MVTKRHAYDGQIENLNPRAFPSLGMLRVEGPLRSMRDSFKQCEAEKEVHKKVIIPKGLGAEQKYSAVRATARQRNPKDQRLTDYTPTQKKAGAQQTAKAHKKSQPFGPTKTETLC